MIPRPEIAAMIGYEGEVLCRREGRDMLYFTNGQTGRLTNFEARVGRNVLRVFWEEWRLVRRLVKP